MRRYFDHLCSVVRIGGPKGLPYRQLAETLMDIPFKVIVPQDQNRVLDAEEMRRDWDDAPRGDASVFEVLISLCQHVMWMAGGIVDNGPKSEEGWFFEMVRNLGILQFSDDIWSDETSEYVRDRVEKWVERDYEYDGTGGIFPLQHPHDDQAKVELWYQMNAYLMERIADF